MFAFALFVAAVAPVVPLEDNPFELLQQLVAAAGVKNWLLVVPLALVLLMYGFRKFIAPKIPFFTTDRGGAVMSLIVAALSAVLSAVLLPGPHSAVAIITASLTGFFSNQLVFMSVNKIVNPKGEDKAQAVEARMAALEAKLAANPVAVANVTNEVVTDLKGMSK